MMQGSLAGLSCFLKTLGNYCFIGRELIRLVLSWYQIFLVLLSSLSLSDYYPWLQVLLIVNSGSVINFV